MLLNLHVKNLALVEEAEIEFGRGLNILTGETGAGKSVILGAVNLALGAKSDSDIIGRYGDSALSELTFRIDGEDKIKILNGMDIYPEDGIVTVTRRIMQGRSVIKVNGETVTAALVRKITELLIDIHGQHDHQSLLYKSKHLEIIDKYAHDEISGIKAKLSAAYTEYKSAAANLDKFKLDEEERRRSVSFLQYEVDEIDAAALTDGEDENIEAEYRRMVNSQKIADSVDLVMKLTGSDGGGAGEAAGRAYNALNSVLQYDSGLCTLLDQIGDIDSLISDFNRDLSDYAASLEFDAARFDAVEKRIDLINSLKAKYGATIAQINEYRAKAQDKLDFYTDYDKNLEAAQNYYDETWQKVQSLCDELTAKRYDAAGGLSEKITEALCDLNFEQVCFEIKFSKASQLSANGQDEAEFMVSLNPGEETKPLAKIASGGELSRIMLGIKSVLAAKDEIGTLIFDEIDTGISGRTAQKVSEKMALIAATHQTICITHLPQIAAMADTHFLIEKNIDNDFTRTSIKELSQDEIIDELSRMLGGTQITDIVRENARQMKSLADGMKQN